MTTSKTDEQALESTIEKSLTGTCLEELKAKGDPITAWSEKEADYTGVNTYRVGFPENFNAQYAIDEKYFWAFLEDTQPDELDKLKRQPDWKLRVLQRYDRIVKKYGLLRLLRKGLEVEDAHLMLMYPIAPAGSSMAALTNFQTNRFSITRQLPYSTDNPRQEIDMALFVNGIPFATMELKNPWTRQNAKVHGQRQYKFERDASQPLLHFGRCLVHFTADPDEVYMTTKLAGANTFFLPFNKGHRNGKGNPPHPVGHKTSYLWEEVLSPTSVAGIIRHFVRFDGKSTDALNTRTLYFPRYHQLDVVRKLIDHVAHHGIGHNYLIQHSAGSGKSNSITWAAYQLIDVTPLEEGLPGGRKVGELLFDSVIVVTDRRLLDKQLRENIKEFSQVKNIIAPAYSSSELKDSLENGKRIIITTIQKFPFIVEGISDLSDKRFAVIIDEAHSGQSGIAHGKMNKAMGNLEAEEDEEEDLQDKILKAIRSRKMRGNASYLAFTATPKNSTLEKFGEKQEDGSFKPFHLYSMKQAIEEGFILDVLANYTTHRSYYELQKSAEQNPEFETSKAQKKLKAYVEQHEDTIAVKAEIMLEHFIENVVKTKKLKGKAKGMVVTQKIESAIKYYQALSRLLNEKGNPFRIAVAFSGEKTLKGNKYTEDSINDLPEHLDTAKPTDPGYIGDKLARYFDMDEYRLLVVANKYLTGFDQPKLTAMYIDKKLEGVQAVQALSRLNRSAPKLGKRTEDLFVLDFYNTTEDIKKSFDGFYTSTKLSSPTDVNVLHELKVHLDELGVYEQSEVEDFNERYFQGVNAEELSPLLNVAADRFNHELELSEDEKADYKVKAKQFVKIYSQVSAIMPFEQVEWEKLFWFLKFLIPKLVVRDPDDEDLNELLNSVDLSTYGIERTKLNARIGLDESDSEFDPQNPNPRGAHNEEGRRDSLDQIISEFNERWFQGWSATPEEQRVKFITLMDKIKAHPDYDQKYAQNSDKQNREIAFQKIFNEVMAQQRRTELELYRMISQDDAFRTALQDTVKRVLASQT